MRSNSLGAPTCIRLRRAVGQRPLCRLLRLRQPLAPKCWLVQHAGSQVVRQGRACTGG